MADPQDSGGSGMSSEQAAQAIADQLRPVWGEDTREEAPKAITLPRETWATVVAALTMQPSEPETDQ